MNLPRNLLFVRILAASAMAAFLPASPALALSPGGISLSSVYAFTNTVLPAAGLVQGTNGNFYGTTETVGTNLSGGIFMLTPSGVYTNLVVFDGTNGAVPEGPLFLSTDGNFYGTTEKGGTSNYGTIFRMTHAGALTTLAKFEGTNGSNPVGGLVLGPHGYYYGTASSGGASGYGTVFAWGPKIGLSNLFSFDLTNGSSPSGGVVADNAENLYGTTFLGGTAGQGTIFKLTPTNTLTALVTFQHTNGAFPCGLVVYSNSLFGATFAGGTNDLGEVFSATTGGSLTVLASFGITNGSNPHGLLLLGTDGYLYGTTLQGGTSGKGVVFRLSTNSTPSTGGGGGRGGRGGGGSGTSQAVLTNLAYFTGANGAYPQGGLMLASNGNIYGTTTSGGTDGYGNVFELLGFPPVIYQQPASQNFAAKGTNHFTVGASGSTPLAYQWLMDGAPLTNGGNISGATNSELTIGPAVLADAGSYSVVVANAFGSATSTVATLTIPSPTLTIKSPGKDVSAALLTVAGTASGKYGVINVQFQLNSNAWSSAATTNQWTNWSASVTLQTGTNVFQAFSVDPLGNHSATNSVTVFYVIKSPLTLLVKGFGTINHTFSGTNLIVGTNYTVTASPNANNLFSNWTGTINTTNNPLTFVMVPNMTLTANFVTNSFLRAVGTYNGLFYVPGAVGVESAGLLGGLTVGKQGAYTGSLYVSGTNYSVGGNFDLAGDASNQIARVASLGAVSLTMHLDWDSWPPQITGTVQGTNGGAWSANLTNELAGTNLSAQYTVLIPPGAGAPANSPGGDGYALISNHLGSLTVTGALADGTTFSQNIAETELHHMPLYATPYTNGGLLLGLLDLGSGAPVGTLTWIRPTATSGLFTNGYTNIVTVQGSAWTDPASDTNAILVRVEQLDVSGGFLSAPIDFIVGLDYKNEDLAVQAGGPTNSLSSKIAPKTGLLTITFGNGNGANTTSATGTILQNHALGGGFFTTKTNAGAFTLTPTQ
jgi:uncharacterized repeat protein (TIGR03803 family)